MAPKDKPTTTPLAHNPFGKLATLRVSPSVPPSVPPSVQISEQSFVKAPESQGSVTADPIFCPKVVVRRERKGHGGKTATVVEGVLASQRETLAGEMKKAFGCGARVEEESIVLQGDIADRACTWLEKRGAKKVVRGS